MDNNVLVSSVLGIIATTIATLLGWIGWLVKKRLDDSKKSQANQEEMKLLIEQFVKNQDVTLSVMKCMIKGLQIALRSDDLQFQSAHNSGLMNGESVEQRKVIRSYMDEVNEMKESLNKVYINPIMGEGTTTESVSLKDL